MDEERKENAQEQESGLSRREFLKDAGLVVGAAVAGGALAGCATTPAPAPQGGAPAAPAAPGAPTTAPAAGAAQPTAAPAAGAAQPVKVTEISTIRGSAFSGFGRDGVPTRVDIKNGKIVRIRPLRYADEGFGPDKLKPWKIEMKGAVLEPNYKKTLVSPLGLSYKKRVYSPNRIRYPLKRVDWEPGGDIKKINSQNRGISKYKRISWDEATTIIAQEIKRIQKQYGYFAILAQGDGHGEGKTVHGPHGCQTQLLRQMGPDVQNSYTLQVRVADSWEGWYWGGKHVTGWETQGTNAPATNMTMEVAQNTQTLLISTDKETTTWMTGDQWPSQLQFWLTKVGVEQVYVTPDLNYAAAVHADKWIPVLPGQDGALYLAIAYIWLTEGTYDKTFLSTHAVGYEKFFDYVLGKEAGDKDGPKTPEWASPRCGVPVWTIKAMAHNWVKRTTSLAGFMGPGMRGTYSTEPTRIQACVEAMQSYGAPGRGRYAFSGTPGRSVSVSFDKTLKQGEPSPARGLEENEAPQDYLRPKQFIQKVRIHDAILNPPISWYGVGSPWYAASDQNRKFNFPIPKEQGGTDIHMMWSDAPCWTTCWNGGNRYIQAVRDPKIEFVLTEHPWMEDDVLLSDIILPTTTKFEEYDISAGGGDVWMVDNGIAPIGESKTDYEVSLEIAKKLDALGGTAPVAAGAATASLVSKYTWGKSVEDWMKWGWDSRNVEKSSGLTWDQFKQKKFFAHPFDPAWPDRLKDKPGARAFYEDPAKNPLKTPTGLIEFESTFMVKNFPNDKERPPVPHWIPEGAFHNENPLGERGKKYPLLCQSNHGRWRLHAENDDVSWLREIETCKVKGIDGYLYEPIWIHPTEAAKRGIVHGDIVGMFNERGMVLGGAYVTERIMPGVAYQDHGARVDPIVDDPKLPQSEFIDRGGANNLICPEKQLSPNCGGQVGSCFLVEVKKVDIQALKAKYPQAFARDYDPAAGLRFSGWVEGGEL